MAALSVPFIGRRLGRKSMVDIQCVGFRVEGEPRAEMVEGRGDDEACI
jgi:hypothetical protein